MKKIDASKHVFVPKHSGVSEKEKEELLRKYNISLSQLPRISKKDAALAGLNLKSGDVVKIIRKSPTSGEAVFYRVVLDG